MDLLLDPLVRILARGHRILVLPPNLRVLALPANLERSYLGLVIVPIPNRVLLNPFRRYLPLGYPT